jgi:hypothetical protein
LWPATHILGLAKRPNNPRIDTTKKQSLTVQHWQAGVNRMLAASW